MKASNQAKKGKIEIEKLETESGSVKRENVMQKSKQEGKKSKQKRRNERRQEKISYRRRE